MCGYPRRSPHPQKVLAESIPQLHWQQSVETAARGGLNRALYRYSNIYSLYATLHIGPDPLPLDKGLPRRRRPQRSAGAGLRGPWLPWCMDAGRNCPNHCFGSAPSLSHSRINRKYLRYSSPDASPSRIGHHARTAGFRLAVRPH